ncbi:class II aldolase/adducin family protein [Streptomyces sp. YS-B37]|uniref:class II aldolase/adducin family protein n=1 Tax=Streptomyces sp. YS-B37 TaxID=3407669 RepID=UPI003B503CB9
MNGHSAIREQVADACHRIAAHGLVVTEAGNVSVRVGGHVVVTATNARFEELTADQVVVVDLDGERVHGDLEPTSELALHLGIYRHFGASAVVHTHAPMATAVGLVVDELPCVHYYMLKLGGSVRVAPYETYGTPELAQSVLTALEGRSAALMANHGAVTHAHSLDAAVDQALLLEWACTLYRNAASMGTPRALDEDRQRAVVETALARMATRPASLPEETS